ncbi:MAG: ribosome silencing factor [Clostridiaceae bacterium]|jgi:ribosome-associated protein|nr:ribosome silencing factor [Clostridiaceae bacterium]
MSPTELKDAIVAILEDKKAIDIAVIPVGERTIIADFFVICTGRSSTQVRTLSDNLVEKMEENGEIVLRTEGVRNGKWAVLDYGAVIVHIFNDETRLFYCLEKHWTEKNPD